MLLAALFWFSSCRILSLISLAMLLGIEDRIPLFDMLFQAYIMTLYDVDTTCNTDIAVD